MDGDRVIFDHEKGSDSELIANGYEPIPVNGKAPVVAGWQEREITPERIAHEPSEHSYALGTGLRTGRLKQDSKVAAALLYVELLTGSADTPVWFRAFTDAGKGEASKFFGTVDDQWPEIESLQAAGCGIFVVVNNGGNSDTEIDRVRATFVDADDAPFPDAWHAEPDFIVSRDETHWHAYWRVDDLPVAEFKEAQQRLAERYGTDKTVCNPSRVLRLAGTLHLKNPANPHLVKITNVREGFDPAFGRSKSELLAGLPPAPVKASQVRERPVKASQETRQAAPDVNLDRDIAIARGIDLIKRRVEQYGRPVIGKGSDNRTYRLAAELKDMALSDAKVVEMLAEHWAPHFNRSYIETKVNSAFAYGQNEPGCDPQRSTEEIFGVAIDKIKDTIAKEAKVFAHKVKRTGAVSNWLNRDIIPQDFLLGELLSTTSRTMIYADTGVGKTHFCEAIAAHVAAGRDFLHWTAGSPRTVLYVDGEMPEGLAQERLRDATRRLGCIPETLFYLNRDDWPDMPPLNTPEGQQFIDRYVEAIDGADLIVLDNIQSLLVGNMRETDSWAAILPWVRELSRRKIGQIWVHHTGHNGDHAYGDKSREWQLDTVIQLVKVEGDICFDVKFDKARNRTPGNRADFDKVRVTLDGDIWRVSRNVTAATSSSLALQISHTLGIHKIYGAAYGFGHTRMAEAMWGAMPEELDVNMQHEWQTKRNHDTERLRDFARKSPEAARLGGKVAKGVGSGKQEWR